VQCGLAADDADVRIGECLESALDSNGQVWCWGANREGGVGDGTTINRTSPVRVATSEWAIALDSTCFLSSAGAPLVLRGRRCFGLKLRRMQVVRRYVGDFYCAQLRLAVELDGPIHDQTWRAEQDLARALQIVEEAAVLISGSRRASSPSRTCGRSCSPS